MIRLYYRDLVLAVYEPRWFMRVLDILRRRRARYRLYYDKSSLTPYSILYTDHEYFAEQARERSDVLVKYDPMDTCRGLEEAILASMNKDAYRQLTVGVDPGPKPYIVVIGDGEVLNHEYVDVGELPSRLLSVKQCYPSDKMTVRVGMGDNGIRLALTISRETDIPVELVDEHYTTPKNRGDGLSRYNRHAIRPFRNKDAYAALRIAMRRGIAFNR